MQEGKELWEVSIHRFDLSLICIFCLQIVIGPDDYFFFTISKMVAHSSFDMF